MITLALVGILLMLAQFTFYTRGIMTDITALKDSTAQLVAIVAQIPPVLAANATLNTKLIGLLEDVMDKVRSIGPSQADIDALNLSVTGALRDLGVDVAAVNATNAALQAEIDKVPVPPLVAPPLVGPPSSTSAA